MRSEGKELRFASGSSAAMFENQADTLIMAAHEMKSPLALVRQLALELQSSNLTEIERIDVANQIQLTAERSMRLSSNLTKYKQLQTTLFVTEPVNVQEIWRGVVQESQPLYNACGRKLEWKGRYHHPLVAANYDLLRRIILNFIDNALHYSDEDGVVELYTKLVHDRAFVRFGVRDYGPALPSKLWKMLQNQELPPQPVHARPDSSGLGLIIAGRFAAAMNGRIGATRHVDGATFYVDVPVTKQLSLL